MDVAGMMPVTISVHHTAVLPIIKRNEGSI